MLFLGDLAHIDGEGWCILAAENEHDNETQSLDFLTLALYEGKPRVIRTRPAKFGNKSEFLCQLQYDEIPDLGSLSVGDSVFYFVNDKEITGGPRKQGKVRHGKITNINTHTQNVVIDHKLPIKLVSVMQYEHNYEQIAGTDAFICQACKSIHTPLKQTAN